MKCFYLTQNVESSIFLKAHYYLFDLNNVTWPAYLSSSLRRDQGGAWARTQTLDSLETMTLIIILLL